MFGIAKRAFAVLGAALMVVSFGAISASATTTTTTPSSRFATYIEGTTGQVIMPTGYPNATITVTQSTVGGSTLGILTESPFRSFFTEDGAPNPPNRHLSLQGGQTGSQTIPNVITITFDQEVPADHLGINFSDVDVETVVISMTSGGPDGPAALTPAQMGFKGVYNSDTGSTINDVPGTSQDSVLNTFTLVAPGSVDTDGSSAWFIPSAGVREITLSSTFTTFGRFYLWFAAIRPEATITATSTTFTLGSDPVIEPLATVSFPEGIIDADFSDSDKTITYSVTDAGGTGCELSGTPLTFTATAAGTCTINAQVSDSPDFVGASTSFAITVVEPPPPPAPEPEPEPEPTPAPAPKPEPTKPPTPTEWTPGTTNFQITTFPGVIELPPPPPPPGGGAYTFTADTASTSLCTVDRDTPTITVPQPGTCSVTASVGATKNFSKASVTVTFTITSGPTLAATGAPAWPLWPVAAGLVGIAMVAMSRAFTTREH